MKSRGKQILIVFLLLVILPGVFLYASSLKARNIFLAGETELKEMALLRDIPVDGKSVDELRTLLYEAEGVSAYEEQVGESEEAKGDYSLTILSSDHLDVLSNGSVDLIGNVSISFSLEDGGSEKILTADEMIVDSSAKRLTAFGNVTYLDKAENTQIENITADIVTFLWDNGSLFVSGGTTSTERTTSEDEKITFYTSGKLLNFRSSDNGLFFDDGYLTSDPDRAYSSISASRLAILEGGDMFFTDAWLKIGRVPVLYIPFFFYPGSRMVGNPAIGFNSSRGMFLSTTFELFGTYPDSDNEDASSFAALLRSDDKDATVSNGLYYTTGEQTPLEKWASDNKSYAAFYFDAYEEAGLTGGFDANISLWNKRVNMKTNSALVISPAYENTGNRKERYYSVNEVKASLSWLNLTLKAPFYSDPYVMRNYANRLTVFSIDSIFNAEQKFPSTYASDITSYNMEFNGSISLPSKLQTKFLDSLRLSSVKANAKYTWDSKEKKYLISDIVLPAFSASMSGTIFSFSSSDRKRAAGEDEESIAYSDYFLLSDPLLYPMYVPTASSSSSSSSKNSYSVSLKYSLKEDFSNSFEIDNETEEVEDKVLSSQSSAKLTFSASAGNYFSLESSLSPSYGYTFKEEKDNEEINNFNLINNNTFSIPAIGITYTLNTELYRFKDVSSDSTSTKDEYSFKWDKESVKKHSIALSKAFSTSVGTFTPSISYVLPPLNAALEPKLSYKYADFTTSFSWLFEKKDEVFKSDTIKLSIGYAGKYFTTSFSGEYESVLLEEDNDYLKPFSSTGSISVRSEDKKYSFTESVKYDGSTDTFSSLKSHLQTPFFYTTYEGKMEKLKYSNSYLEVGTDIRNFNIKTWKNRITFKGSVNSAFHYDFENPYSSYFTLKTALGFSIAEFMDISFSVTTGNNSFFKYYDNDKNFHFSWLFEDFLRSFDFFGTGRNNTSFNMEEISVELVHYLGDWDLHCKYSAEVVSSGSGYSWVPEFSIYIKWNMLPDIKVDESWKKSDVEWVKTQSPYSND